VALEAEADCKRGGATKLSANARDAIEHAEEAKAAVLSFSAAHRQEVGGLRFPSWNRPILTEIYLCHACSYHEFEDHLGIGPYWLRFTYVTPVRGKK
jgi:hypothetical protein